MRTLGQLEVNPAASFARKQKDSVSSFSFYLYIYFLVDFFLHFSARLPIYGMIRPTLLLVLIISLSLFTQQKVLKGKGQNESFKAIMILLSYLFVSVPFVEWPGSVLKNNIPDFVKAVVFLFFTALIVDTPKRLKITIFVFASCQVIRVLEPLFLNITTGYWGSKTHLGSGEYAERLSGAPSDVINSNELGFVIATAVPFLYYLCWRGNFKKKLVFMILMPLMMYALLLTMSRGAMIALGVVVFFIFKDSNKKTLMVGILLVAVIGAWSTLSPVQRDRYLSLVDEDTVGAATVDGRFRGMVYEFELGLKRPIFGHGVGTTSEAKVHDGRRGQAAHNLYAELIIEIGLLGAIIFLWYLATVYRSFKRNKELIRDAKITDEYFLKLNASLTALFWMYAVYSINYMGLTVWYWYFLGGISIAFGRIIMTSPEAVEFSRTQVDLKSRYRLSSSRQVRHSSV